MHLKTEKILFYLKKGKKYDFILKHKNILFHLKTGKNMTPDLVFINFVILCHEIFVEQINLNLNCYPISIKVGRGGGVGSRKSKRKG